MQKQLKRTTELQNGDVVWNHGMQILISNRQSATYNDQENVTRTIVWFTGEILNVEEVNAEGFIPFSWRCDKNKLGNEWTIQGNELARWAVEVTEVNA